MDSSNRCTLCTHFKIEKSLDSLLNPNIHYWFLFNRYIRHKELYTQLQTFRGKCIVNITVSNAHEYTCNWLAIEIENFISFDKHTHSYRYDVFIEDLRRVLNRLLYISNGYPGIVLVSFSNATVEQPQTLKTIAAAKVNPHDYWKAWGKSTIGRELAARNHIPVIDKNSFKLALDINILIPDKLVWEKPE